MRRFRLLAALLSLATIAAGALAAAAQPPPPDPSPPGGVATFDESLSISWLLVPVVVRSRRGHVEGLGKEDFRLFVDGRETPIQELDLGSEVPLSVIYLQDLSGSMANSGKLGASRRAFSSLLDRVGAGDQVALATFAGDRLRIEVPFTGEVLTLREAMAWWEGYGTTALHDAVSVLPDISEEGRSGRRVAVLVTDGVDNASALAPEEAVRIVREARLPVYVIGLTGAGRGDGGRGAEHAYLYSELLESLAERTGGRSFEVADEAAAAAAVASLVADLRHRYVLAVTTAGDAPPSYHEVRVEARLPYRHTLTFRKGYYGGPPVAAGTP
jgi:VWFA-related protein